MISTELRERNTNAARKYRAAHPERPAEAARRYREKYPGRATADMRRYRASKPSGHWRAYQLKKQYGITVEDYEELTSKQDGKCAICGGKDKTRLHVDHCHATKRVRGLLCYRCNMGIGYFKEDQARLVNAIDYLTT